MAKLCHHIRWLLPRQCYLPASFSDGCQRTLSPPCLWLEWLPCVMVGVAAALVSLCQPCLLSPDPVLLPHITCMAPLWREPTQTRSSLHWLIKIVLIPVVSSFICCQSYKFPKFTGVSYLTFSSKYLGKSFCSTALKCRAQYEGHTANWLRVWTSFESNGS